MLKHEDGRTRFRIKFIYDAGKFGKLEYWPEMLDDLRDGFH